MAGIDVYHVYVVECSDGTLYTGIALSVEKRIAEHNSGTGAKYTRGRGPVQLLASTSIISRSAAQELESFIKKQPRDKKVEMLKAFEKARDASGNEMYRLIDFRCMRRIAVLDDLWK